ncbi:hypothetical protein E7T06_14470 [Deinococcus sp. Arct2-2]|uniref:hypothetical protein n=1 Tax=Deinococcus sp. Arct2-2 TaxID=2568653 RepID=UPI0010A52EA3|nr:hypothetical protein [Deinococcus sp. Arct2-2]THF68869.1 hypothetical protein E7T06_14470 [Deinococcus sp. Arct2-2]
MADIVINMDAEVARQRIFTSELEEIEQSRYLNFVEHFPSANFYANTMDALQSYQEDQKIKLPAWFLTYRSTLAEAYAGADDLALQFASFTDQFHVGSPRRRQLSDMWYTLSLPGLPKGKKERNILLKGSPSIKLFPIAVDIVDDRYQLGINLNKDDTRIYEYHIEDVQASFSNGEDISVSLFPVFASPGDLLSRIQNIRHEGHIDTSAASP